ncbi:hypothetical protein ASPCAL07687 [Aspergillus calidoustus]|uniref:Uncharacterized protein n=1 Tax=Aspergillus calidoustus TaxID=454130 RepID=A0A0U5GRD6_ASPCI|nr:hypothetical protein ASPCAL07687 [Aspergillus calidoustus]
MLMARRSTALPSIVLGLLVLFWSAPTVIAYDGSCDYNDINEPIGIDLGYQYIAASYANSTTVFTPLAVVQNAEYRTVIAQLSFEHYELLNLKALYGDRASVSGLLKLLLSHFAGDVVGKIPYIDHPYVQAVLGASGRIYAHVSLFIRAAVSVVSWQQEPTDHLTLAGIEEAFTRIFTHLKSTARTDTGTDISFAIIAIPDFFNQTIAETVAVASRRAAIETVAQPLPRSSLASFENPDIRAGDDVLVLHQGIHHCGIRLWHNAGGTRTGGRKGFRRGYSDREQADSSLLPPNLYLSLDPWRMHAVYTGLTRKLLRESEPLRTQLQVGADFQVLVSRVTMARMWLKKQDVRAMYIGTESYTADFYSTLDHAAVEPENFDDEVLVDLDDWWVYGSNSGVSLTREMVEAVDQQYVESLANSISVFVDTIQDQSLLNSVVDQVAVLTDWVDGDLVRRAVEEALSNYLPLIGGSMSDLTLAADGAARLALIRRQNLLRMQEQEYSIQYYEL